MATAATVNYSIASGASIYAGRINSMLPAWREGMLAGTWSTIPATNTIAQIDPEDNPAINPNYPANAPWHATGGLPMLMAAWCGASFDTDTDTLLIPLGGGHGDYAGNEPYKINLRNDNPSWEMIRNPTGAIGNTGSLAGGVPNSYEYFDGRLRAAHTYNNHCFAPGFGHIISRVNATYPDGTGGVKRVYRLDDETGETTLISDFGALADTGGSAEGGSCYDPDRHYVWQIAASTCKIVRTDLSTGISSTGSGNDSWVSGGYGRLLYLTGLGYVCLLHGGGIRIYDPSNSTFYLPSITGSFASGFSLTGANGGQSGSAWDAENQRILLWHNSSNRIQISTLTPPASGDKRTGVWIAGALNVDPSNTVTPTTRQINGTYGRFGYSPYLKGCYLINAVDQPIYFFATE